MVQKADKRENSSRDTNPAEVASIRQESDDIRTGTSSGTLRQAILDNLYYVQATHPGACHAERLVYGGGLYGAATGCWNALSVRSRDCGDRR